MVSKASIVFIRSTKNKTTALKGIVVAVLITKRSAAFAAVGSTSLSLGVAAVAYTLLPAIVKITAIVAKVVARHAFPTTTSTFVETHGYSFLFRFLCAVFVLMHHSPNLFYRGAGAHGENSNNVDLIL
jgi:hypothetical protein